MKNLPENNLTILTKINAFRVYTENGYDEAIRLYPECADFITAHKSKTLQEVTKELDTQLQS